VTVRRVVTGITAGGASAVVSDGPPPCVLTPEHLPGMEVVYLWSSDAVPSVPNAGADETSVDQEFFPGRDGSRFLVITYPPGFGAGPPDPDARTSGVSAPTTFHRLLLHATPTVDYAIVLQGQMTLMLDAGEEIILRPTDTVVQNGAVHGWRNASDEVAVIAFVMLGGQQPPTHDEEGGSVS
jgi:hypothetical protein